MASSEMAIPGAIVVGSIILASGLYLGLQPARPDPVRTPESAVRPVESQPVVSAASTVPPTVSESLSPEVRARGAEHARLALEDVREELVRRCWTPDAAKQPEPRRISLVFNMSFSAQGQLTGIGLTEDRTASRPVVANCVRALPVNLTIPAPGGLLLVEVPFTMP